MNCGGGGGIKLWWGKENISKSTGVGDFFSWGKKGGGGACPIPLSRKNSGRRGIKNHILGKKPSSLFNYYKRMNNLPPPHFKS